MPRLWAIKELRQRSIDKWAEFSSASETQCAIVEHWRTAWWDAIVYSELEIVPQRKLRNSLVTPVTGRSNLTKRGRYQSVIWGIQVSPIEHVE